MKKWWNAGCSSGRKLDIDRNASIDHILKCNKNVAFRLVARLPIVSTVLFQRFFMYGNSQFEKEKEKATDILCILRKKAQK